MNDKKQHVNVGTPSHIDHGVVAGQVERLVSTMPQVTIVFPSNVTRDDFMAWLCDGGGEQMFMELGQHTETQIEVFDYSRAFPAWGYDEKKHGEPVVVCEC